MTLLKICVLGEGGVGKTALTIQLCSNHFVEEYDPTIEDSYRKQIVLENQVTLLEILDTAGQEEFTALRDQWIRDCEGFLIVYSITSRHTFDQTPIFKDQVLRVKDVRVAPMMLVGNKSDLGHMREVEEREGKDLAKTFGAQFKETSAKTRLGVEEAFYDLVRAVRLQHQGDVVETNPQNNGKPKSQKGIRKLLASNDGCSLL